MRFIHIFALLCLLSFVFLQSPKEERDKALKDLVEKMKQRYNNVENGQDFPTVDDLAKGKGNLNIEKNKERMKNLRRIDEVVVAKPIDAKPIP